MAEAEAAAELQRLEDEAAAARELAAQPGLEEQIQGP
jgi:hypothetical protein